MRKTGRRALASDAATCEMMATPVVISYARYSSKGQRQGNSVRRQLVLSAAWAES